MKAMRAVDRSYLKCFAALAATCVLLSSPVRVAADVALSGPLKLLTGATCETPGGTHLDLNPGRYVPEQWWLNHEAEDREAAKQIIRIEAENESLRQSAEGLNLGWGTVILVGTALVTGAYIGTRL